MFYPFQIDLMSNQHPTKVLRLLDCSWPYNYSTPNLPTTPPFWREPDSKQHSETILKDNVLFKTGTKTGTKSCNTTFQEPNDLDYDAVVPVPGLGGRMPTKAYRDVFTASWDRDNGIKIRRIHKPRMQELMKRLIFFHARR